MEDNNKTIILRAEELSVSLTDEEENQQIDILDDLNITIFKGEIYGLFGLPRSGKTTLLKTLMGQIRPDKGRIFLNEEPLNIRVAYSRISYVSFDPLFSSSMNGRKLLLRKAEEYDIPVSEITYEIDRVIKESSLGVKATQSVKTYTESQRQRFAIALALLNKPDLLIIDEPSFGYDQVHLLWLTDLVKRLSTYGITILLSSSQFTEVEKLAHHIGFLRNGKIVNDIEIEKAKKPFSPEDTFLNEIGYLLRE